MRLLQEAGIEFKTLKNNSSEEIDISGLLPQEIVLQISQDKMNRADLPIDLQPGTEFLALSADTLDFTPDFRIFGKPKDEADAIEMLKALRENPISVFTGCCLRKFRFEPNGHKILKTESFFARTQVVFRISDDEIEKYLEGIPDYLSKSGAFAVQDFGAQFIESINGSYTSILGIPMFELQQNLRKIGFYD